MRMKNFHERLNVQGLCRYFLDSEFCCSDRNNREDNILSPDKRDAKFFNGIMDGLRNYSYLLISQNWNELSEIDKEFKMEEYQGELCEEMGAYADFNFEMGVMAGLQFAFSMVDSIVSFKKGCSGNEAR